MAERFFSWIFNFFDDGGWAPVFTFFFIIVCLLSILVQKVEPVETEFFSFFCFLNLIFLFSKDRHPYYVFWGKLSHSFTEKITELPKKNQFPT